jgi:hypothetical protein
VNDIAVYLGSMIGLAASGYVICGLAMLFDRLGDYRDPQERREARRLRQ